jgi:hypothetical protein
MELAIMAIKYQLPSRLIRGKDGRDYHRPIFPKNVNDIMDTLEAYQNHCKEYGVIAKSEDLWTKQVKLPDGKIIFETPPVFIDNWGIDAVRFGRIIRGAETSLNEESGKVEITFYVPDGEAEDA